MLRRTHEWFGGREAFAASHSDASCRLGRGKAESLVGVMADRGCMGMILQNCHNPTLTTRRSQQMGAVGRPALPPQTQR